MTSLLAADGPRKPRKPALDCSDCGCTRGRCDSGFWLRGGYCCSACEHKENDA